MHVDVALVTGATGAIGKAITRALAEAGHTVVLACRNENKAAVVVAEIRRATGNERIRYEVVDLSSRSQIESLASRWEGSLQVLVNNACDTPRERRKTTDGLEVQFATNILGYFWMTQAFVDVLHRSAPSRVINVASYWAGDLDIHDLQFERRRYNNNTAYRQSKQANRMLTVAFSQRLADAGIFVNACHPGDVPSALALSLGFGGHETASKAAQTPVWLATDQVGQQCTGKYFEHMREKTCQFAHDRDAIEALYQACLNVTPSAG